MHLYQDEEGVVYGYSKWFHNDGNFSWKKCRILNFDPSDERWVIEWLSSGVNKKVSRANLMFEAEGVDKF